MTSGGPEVGVTVSGDVTMNGRNSVWHMLMKHWDVGSFLFQLFDMQDGKSCQTRLFCVIDGMLLMEVQDVLVSAAPVFRPSPLFFKTS